MNGALLSPGSSPGILTVSNNVSLGESSVYRADIFGYGAGTEYDQLVIAGSSGTVSLNGATLEIDLNGFNPDFNATFTIISGFSGEPGTFGSITLQNATTFQNQHKLFEVIYENDTSVSLSVVPEPAVIGLVVMAGLLAMARRKK